MRIESVTIDKFGGLRGFEMRFDKGLTVIFGANESGKTTLAAFIRAMLYGMNGKSASVLLNERKKYMPWNETGMGGSLRLTDGKAVYEIARTFGATKKSDSCTVVDAQTGEIIPIPAGKEPGDVLLGVEEAVFLDTLYLTLRGSRLSGDGAALAERIRNRIGTGAEDVDLNKIMERLQAAKSAVAPRVKDRGALAQVRRDMDAAREQLMQCAQQERQAQQLEQRLQALEKPVSADGKHEERRSALYRSGEELDARIRAAEDKLEAQERRERRSRAGKQVAAGVLLMLALAAAVGSVLGGMLVSGVWYAGLVAAVGLFAAAAFVLLHKGNADEEETDAVLAELSLLRQDQAMLRQQSDTLLMQMERIGRADPQKEDERVKLRVALEQARQKAKEMQELKARIKVLEDKEARLLNMVSALDMAQEELREAARERQEGIAPEIVRGMEEMLTGMTAGRYGRAAATRELSLSLQPEHGSLRTWEYFSAGTVEQMYLALRLSLVRTMCKGTQKLPMILDDALMHFDDERAQDALQLLKDFAADGQILLMTCRERETRGVRCVRM